MMTKMHQIEITLPPIITTMFQEMSDHSANVSLLGTGNPASAASSAKSSRFRSFYHPAENSLNFGSCIKTVTGSSYRYVTTTRLIAVIGSIAPTLSTFVWVCQTQQNLCCCYRLWESNNEVVDVTC
eukprot:1775740-Amphidinium_carterae.1